MQQTGMGKDAGDTVIERPKLFGASYSVYVRIVRLALFEKGIAYDHVPIDIFAAEQVPVHYRELQPFGRIPAFEHAGFSLYETGAISRYVDEAFDGPSLQPTSADARARCNQLISIADNYAYPNLVWGIFVERISKPKRGEVADEDRVRAATTVARTCLKAITAIMGDNRWLAGPDVTLADLYAAPMFAYFLMAEEGMTMLLEHPSLERWWSRIAERPSMLASEPR